MVSSRPGRILVRTPIKLLGLVMLAPSKGAASAYQFYVLPSALILILCFVEGIEPWSYGFLPNDQSTELTVEG